LRACERSFIQAAFRVSDGNQSKTARLLGITPRSVYNKLRRHRIA
jgi:DNA-binding NtrC family response regulator